MMRIFEDQHFEHFLDRDSAAVFADAEFRNCRFYDCDISITQDPRLRSTARNIVLVNCEYVEWAGLSCAILENILVNGLKTRGLLQTWGAVFKHVTLRGRIDRLMISTGTCPTATTTTRELRSFEEANSAYYANVDWALDISQAEFKECDIRGIPARLIRRDPETQVVVTREKALQGAWKELDLGRTYWPTAIEFLLECGWEDDVLVAPKRARNFRDLLAGLDLLRNGGVAEPD